MIESEPLVTIIVPYFNREHFLANLIDCLCKQTYKHIEVIFVDDCSSTPLKDLISASSQIKLNYKVIRNEKNIGVSASRNKGVNLASGCFICFLDSDDIWRENKVQLCVDACKHFTHSDKIFVMSKSLVNTANSQHILPDIKTFSVSTGEDYLFKYGLFAQVSSFFLSTALAKNIDFNESLNQYEDFLYFIDAYNQADYRLFLDDVLVEWDNNQNRLDRLSMDKTERQAAKFISILSKQSSQIATNRFYMRFVYPYYFKSNFKHSLNQMIFAIRNKTLNLQLIGWLTVRGVLGETLISKVRGLLKK